ncbi:MAG: hypothetical protein ACRDUY_12395, partial [Nitriliruptorales bacterium]
RSASSGPASSVPPPWSAGGLAVTRLSLTSEPRRLLEPIEWRYFPQEHAATFDPVADSSPFEPFALGPSG